MSWAEGVESPAAMGLGRAGGFLMVWVSLSMPEDVVDLLPATLFQLPVTCFSCLPPLPVACTYIVSFFS